MGNSLDKFNDLEESLREERNRVIAQNGNDGLHYEDGELLSQEDFDYNIAKTRKETAAERKGIPVFSGMINYFPDAIREVAKCSRVGNDQHSPNQPLAWDRSKSGDELDAMMRHLLDHASGELFDDCGTRHIVKCGWRILAFIQKTMEDEKNNKNK